MIINRLAFCRVYRHHVQLKNGTHICAIVQVERDAKNVYNFQVCFNVDGETNIFKYFYNLFVHSIYLLTIYISQNEQSVIPIKATIIFID